MEQILTVLKRTPGWVVFFAIAFFIYLMGKTFGKP